MEFSDFLKEFKKNAENIFESNQHLFLANVEKEDLWNTYLESYPTDKNKVFRVRREFDCSCCRSFIKNFSNVVSIQDGEIVTFWDFDTNDDTFQPMIEAMREIVKSSFVSDSFVTKNADFGTERTREIIESNLVHVWNHFNIKVPNKFIFKNSASVNEEASSRRDVKNVFKRSLEEITPDSVQTVLDLIEENSLYRGEEWKQVLEKFAKIQKAFNKLKNNSLKENFCWAKSLEVGGSIGKIKNHSIGTLLIDISNGMEIDEAVRRYESIIAPTNYKRPKAIFTTKMVSQAQETIEKLGLKDSLGRQHSKISDITINNVIWANRNAKNKMNNVDDIFESLKDDALQSPNKYKNIQGISIEEFLNGLDKTKSIEILMENRLEGNLVSLISPKDKESQSLFKWDNGFSWSYNGNIADSMKQRVKSAGGKVDGVLRFSLLWHGDSDLDAHCIEPNGNEIFFRVKNVVQSSTGILDVDIVNPVHGVPSVENITWSNGNRIQKGIHKLFVLNYNSRGGEDGFEAEIEFNGEIHEFSYAKPLRLKEEVLVAEVYHDGKGNFTIEKSLPSSISSKNVWNLKTNKFVPVSVFMFSPNYWDGQVGIGNKHYFFMLPDCKNETNPNGFYNEYLKEDFTKHRKVFEALGGKMKVENSEEQLSGLGFSSTMQNYIIAKVDGRVTKIIF
jgi:hypothetical protein